MLMAKWENALAVRDLVFFQVFILALVGYGLYRYFPKLDKYMLIVATGCYIALYLLTLWNMLNWSPTS